MHKHRKLTKDGKHEVLFKDIVPRWTVKTRDEFTPAQLAALEQQLRARMATGKTWRKIHA